MNKGTLALAIVLLGGCASAQGGSGARGRVVAQLAPGQDVTWSEQEQRQPFSLRNLRRTPEASFHLLRVHEGKQARVHAQSDLVLMTVAGPLELTVDDRTLTLTAGDVVEIPRGTPYTVEDRAAEPSVAYLVFTPALDPSDVQPVRGPVERDSAWQWNLWLQ